MHYKDKPYKKRIARIPKSKVKHFIVLFNKISDFYGSNVAAFNKLGISSNVYKEMRNGVLTSKMASIILTAHKKLPKDKS
jgi:hypothetical protein